MDRVPGFYPVDAGSTPARGTIISQNYFYNIWLLFFVDINKIPSQALMVMQLAFNQ